MGWVGLDTDVASKAFFAAFMVIELLSIVALYVWRCWMSISSVLWQVRLDLCTAYNRLQRLFGF